ncbi:uncharacterized protein TNCV_1972471 [Trichonephila clavipes]|nr:uncharacterized protein TNCV_1972471 [Trichonephila clavipes]
MRLYFLISTCVCFGLVYTTKCPDGTPCEENDICCQRYLLGRTFICCTQNLACTKTFGIGHCVPKQQRSRTIFRPIRDLENELNREFYEDYYYKN